MQFDLYYSQKNFTEQKEKILAKGSLPHAKGRGEDIPAILQKQKEAQILEEDELLSLLSPQADSYLEEIIAHSRSLSRQRFGHVMQFYAPLYLSNHCHSTCTYCGFSRSNSIRRLTLSVEEALQEAELLYQRGIRHILLLTGEDYKATPLEYIEEIVRELSLRFASVSIEIYPLETKDYIRLRELGLDGVAVYQETYDPKRYEEVHLGGMKKRMQYRLECPDRVGQASIRRLAIGALLGLSDPATEIFFLSIHARYLMRRYWQTELSISLPRLQPAIGLDHPPLLSDRDYLRYLCVLRLFLPEAGLILSTREAPEMRDHLADICITQMSAGSKTEPGGYSGKESDEQFQIRDHRSLAELSQSLMEQKNLEPVFIDWSPALNPRLSKAL